MQKKGFTLIELIVVIGIIGILVAIVSASLSAARIKGRDAKRVGDIKQTQQALENFFENSNSYPQTAASNAIPSSLTAYLTSIPQDPVASNSPYQYICTDILPGVGTCIGYCLAVNLEGTPPPSLPPSASCITGYSYSIKVP